MKLTLIQPMADGTYRIKYLDVREKTLSLDEPESSFPSMESAREHVKTGRLQYVLTTPEGEIWV
jgi:hypothetical protein